MTHRQKEKLQHIFNGSDIIIRYMMPLDFLMVEWRNYPDIRDKLEDFDYEELEKCFGKRLADRIANNDPDCSEYLYDFGGIFMVVEIRPLDGPSIRLDENGNFNGGTLAGYHRVIPFHAKNYDAAICKACAEAKKLDVDAIKQARRLRDMMENE